MPSFFYKEKLLAMKAVEENNITRVSKTRYAGSAFLVTGYEPEEQPK